MHGQLLPSLSVDLAPVLFIGAVQGLVIQSALEGDGRASTRRARRALGLRSTATEGWPPNVNKRVDEAREDGCLASPASFVSARFARESLNRVKHREVRPSRQLARARDP